MLSREHTECISIVSLLSASLISLGAHLVHLPIRSTSLLQSKLRFPLLQDLSIGCSCGNMATSGLPLFPSLRRFHIYINSSQVQEVTSFVHASPQLTHIRLSNIAQASWFTGFLRDALQHESTAALRLPLGLKKLILLPATFDRVLPGGSLRRPNVLLGLRSLAIRYETVVLLPDGDYHGEDAKADWFDTVTGGDGCWRVSPSETSAA
jgi:hypothetical protein